MGPAASYTACMKRNWIHRPDGVKANEISHQKYMNNIRINIPLATVSGDVGHV